jgi:heme/copper-type cytochrome/quinol oxidase subunit 2
MIINTFKKVNSIHNVIKYFLSMIIGPSDAVLIGAIIGAVVGVVVIILMVLCCIRCLKSNKPVEDEEIGTNENVDVEEVDVKEVEISVLDCNSSEVTNPPL